MNTQQNVADLTGRILISAIFLISGLGKIGGYAATQGYMLTRNKFWESILLLVVAFTMFRTTAFSSIVPRTASKSLSVSASVRSSPYPIREAEPNSLLESSRTALWSESAAFWPSSRIV